MANWFPFRKPRPGVRLRLFCFPYAGGGAGVYRTWAAQLPPTVEVCAVGLPGREARFSEPLFTSLSALLDGLHAATLPLLDLPFAFFGHSMGAVVSYELARRLEREGRPAPVHFFPSGATGPQVPDRQPNLYQLPDPELIAALRRYNGTPAEVLNHPVLMELLLPILRADFTVLDTYVHDAAGGKLRCPVTALGGIADQTVPHALLEPWREVTTGPAAVRMFDGDHFFLGPRQAEVTALVSATLQPHL